VDPVTVGLGDLNVDNLILTGIYTKSAGGIVFAKPIFDALWWPLVPI